MLLSTSKTVFLGQLIQLFDVPPGTIVIVEVHFSGCGVHDDRVVPALQLHREITGDGIGVELDALLAGREWKAEGGTGLDQVGQAADGSLDGGYMANKSPRW